MTEKEILHKVLEKAVENGFDFKSWWAKEAPNTIRYIPADNNLMLKDEFGFEWVVEHPNTILFDHAFVKAFFGEEWNCNNCGESHYEIVKNCVDFDEAKRIFRWAYHIQQLALAEDRLKYLSEFI